MNQTNKHDICWHVDLNETIKYQRNFKFHCENLFWYTLTHTHIYIWMDMFSRVSLYVWYSIYNKRTQVDQIDEFNL